MKVITRTRKLGLRLLVALASARRAETPFTWPLALAYGDLKSSLVRSVQALLVGAIPAALVWMNTARHLPVRCCHVLVRALPGQSDCQSVRCG